MVEKFNMDMNVGIEQKPPFYQIFLSKQFGNTMFVVTKKIDVVRSPVNGLLDITGFWADVTDEDITNLVDREICSIILPINNIAYIKNLMYRPR